MKTLEEIQQLAKDSWEGCDGCDANDEYFFIKGFGCGYRQLREEVYTKEDMLKCWNTAWADAVSIDFETYEPTFYEDFIKTLNK